MKTKMTCGVLLPLVIGAATCTRFERVVWRAEEPADLTNLIVSARSSQRGESGDTLESGDTIPIS
jgi:hypothetical protein